MSRKGKQALAEAMREWPQRVVDAGVRQKDGAKYRPVARNVTPLRYLNNPDHLVTDMRRILDEPDWDDPNTGSSGWDRIMKQAGPGYLWEWLIMDRTAPWADEFTDEHRWKVAIAIAHTLRRSLNDFQQGSDMDWRS
jgi:hypothetical protein